MRRRYLGIRSRTRRCLVRALGLFGHGVFERLGAQRLHPGTEGFERDHLLGLEPARRVFAFDDGKIRRDFDELFEAPDRGASPRLCPRPMAQRPAAPREPRPQLPTFSLCLPTNSQFARDNCASSASSRSVVPMSYHRPSMQFTAEGALGDGLAQQRQQRKLSGLAAREQLGAKNADARIREPRSLAI